MAATLGASSNTVSANGVKKSTSAAPSQTLYITNLPTKIQKTDIRRALYCLFSTFGPVLDVVALKTLKMRGQAHVVHRDIHTSTQAMRSLQGYEFLGRELKISYAHGKSHILSRLDGTARSEDLKPEQAATASTELQRSIFNAPLPNSLPAPVSSNFTLPPAPAKTTGMLNGAMEDSEKRSQGVKRSREDDEEQKEKTADTPMDEDSGGEDMMEESDSD